MHFPPWVWPLLALAFVGMLSHRWTPSALEVPDGVIVAANAPLQTELTRAARWQLPGYSIKALANF